MLWQRDADCYSSAEQCVSGTCICQMWGPREQHAAAVYNGYMYARLDACRPPTSATPHRIVHVSVPGSYVSGGYTSQQLRDCGHYPCGDTDASSYRYYMQVRGYKRVETLHFSSVDKNDDLI